MATQSRKRVADPVLCLFCNQMYDPKEITRHVQACQQHHAEDNIGGKQALMDLIEGRKTLGMYLCMVLFLNF